MLRSSQPRSRARRRRSNPPCSTSASSQVLGNIYVCEALWRARISPKRGAARLKPAEIAALVPHIKAVLREAIKAGGSSLRDHKRTDGELGYFQHRFAVYDRKGKPCKHDDGRHDQAHRAERTVDVLLPGLSEIKKEPPSPPRMWGRGPG